MFHADTAAKLNNIPIASWVTGTVRKMNQKGTHSKAHWNETWLDTYFELGGKSKESGAKPCPKAAAYGLWLFGYLCEGKRPFYNIWTADRDNLRLGKNKNAAYAAIAVELLTQGAPSQIGKLWPMVQAEYAKRTGHSPAGSEQGEIRLVAGLFQDRQIVVS
ncbi:hypothetical protein Q8A64_00130 [Oxalobacteraceae bacterium R-40]|uniref:Uncharacterized protein n=1 Tax=Keguizhuia sedimenti TaxID=3064264 RepID=A0ABU1BIG7_9BURK|nr:hypothetical protein [Oxalobacteraceae bacterium R-40]